MNYAVPAILLLAILLKKVGECKVGHSQKPSDAVNEPARNQLALVLEMLVELRSSSIGNLPQIQAAIDQLSIITGDTKFRLDRPFNMLGPDGKINHGGVLGSILGQAIRPLAVTVAGQPGICGDGNKIVMTEHQGLFGTIFDTLKPLGPLARD